jgi:DNA-binding response OmpR family regulator
MLRHELRAGIRGRTMEPRPLRILLVEDEVDVAEMYKVRLELDGLQVQVASTGAKALIQIASGLPDLLLLDVHLPDFDGLALLALLRAGGRSASLPVMILSNENDPIFIQRAFELGAADYLRKSATTPDSLSLRIKAWAPKATAIDVA